MATARIALVGDRSPSVRAHTRIPKMLDDLDAYWIPTEDADTLDKFDAIWLVPGSPYRSEEGALAAVRTAREQGIPFLGTCGGFQHMVMEYASNVCGVADVHHAETAPDAVNPVIMPLTCSLVGHEGTVNVTPGSLAERILGAERTTERYHCSYGTNPDYLETLQEHGLRFTGADDAGDVRIAELENHPFFLATLFQPELTDGHPIVKALVAAVR